MGEWMTFLVDPSLQRICRVLGGCATPARDPSPSETGIDRPSVAVAPPPRPSAASAVTLADPPTPLSGFLPATFNKNNSVIPPTRGKDPIAPLPPPKKTKKMSSPPSD